EITDAGRWRRLHAGYLRLLLRHAPEARTVLQDARLQLHRLPAVRRGLRVFFRNEKACRKFVAETYDGDLVLFRASHQPRTLAKSHDPALGWREQVRGTVRVIDLEAHHTGMFRGEVLRHMLPHVLALLDEANEEGRN